MHSQHEHLTHAERAALGLTAGDLARVGREVVPASDDAADRRLTVQSVDDVLALLTYAASFDDTKRGRFQAAAWLEVLRGYPVDDVRDAITEHFRHSRYRIMPADVIEILEEGL